LSVYHGYLSLICGKRIIVVLIIFLYTNSFSQTNDSIQINDSLRFYKKIKKVAFKYGFTRWVYNAVFVDPEPIEYPTIQLPKQVKEVKQINPYLKYEKKIIRNVLITVLDPFGHTINDTIEGKIDKLKKGANKLHIKTRQWVIRNRLLFKANDSINPLKLSETERIMRTAIFVNDAKIFVSKTDSKDSVDVNVIVIDKWAVILPAELISESSGRATFINDNLFGWGQQFQQYVSYSKPNILNFKGFYNIDNISDRFIASRINYEINKDYKQVSLSVDKPFYSPLVKYAWAVNFNNIWSKRSFTDSIDSIPRLFKINNFSYDLWLGRTIKLNKDLTIFNQSTNILIGARHYKNIFLDRPSFDVDTKKTNSTNTAVLANVGFAVQQYYKDKYIYRFGATEDVPEGLIAQVILGGIKPEFFSLRYYIGAEVARAKHFKFGYLTSTISVGLLFNKTITNDITTNYKLYYFSNLYKKGRWVFRQFLNYDWVYGNNKVNKEVIILNNNELYGFQNQSLQGNTKMILNSETVAYMPYKFIGFRFAPVMQVGLGIIGDDKSSINKSRLYQGYTIGLMLRNENLLNSTFQFSMGMYPFFPDGGNYQFIYNPVGSFTLRVRSFSVSRPEFVSYY